MYKQITLNKKSRQLGGAGPTLTGQNTITMAFFLDPHEDYSIVTYFFTESSEHVKEIVLSKLQQVPFARAAVGQFNDLSKT